MKSLTIITNFEGAHVGVPVTTLSSLDMLKDAIKYENADQVRVMGGSDPLYEIEKHQKYYGRLFRICREMDIPVHLTTSKVDSDFPYGRCRTVRYRVDNFDDLAKVKAHGREVVMVDFIVGKGCTIELIDKIFDYRCNAGCKIADLKFRLDSSERGSHLPKNCHEYLAAGHAERRWDYVTVPTDVPPYFVNGEIYYSASDVFK